MGYMGSGKSEIGSMIAKRNSIPFVDLDQYIELKEKKTITNFFRKNGELFFRKKERIHLEQVLMNKSSLVVSLGGGTPCYFDNINYINKKKNTLTIFLNSSPKELSQRLFRNRNNRPLISHLNSIDELEDFIAKHLFERLPYYNKAKIKVNTDGKSLMELLHEIEDLLA